jgi:uncharacterized coiled-coil DUF342 family protein
MICERHQQVKAPGLCPICLIEERDELAGRCERLSGWVDQYKGEIERLRAEDEIWDKHSLVQIVTERDELRAEADRLRRDFIEESDDASRLQAEVERLRGALQFLEPSARELLAVANEETAAYRRRWRMAIEQARAVCAALDDHD